MTEKNVAADALAKLGSKEVAAVSPVQQKRAELTKLFSDYRGQLEQALPKMIPVDRLIRVALTSVNKTPALMKCTSASIVSAVLQSAQLGLMPDGVTGEAYLLPFNNKKKLPNGQWETVTEAQFIAGYRGLITLAYRSGVVQSFQARAVYEHDKFDFEFGLNEKLSHIPGTNADGLRGQLTHVYAVVRMKNGGYVMDVMSRQEVEEVRRFSKNAEGVIWVNHYPEMAIKTIIRRISKRCPLSPEFQTAVSLDEQAEVINAPQHNIINMVDIPGTLADEAADEIETINVTAAEEVKEEKLAAPAKKAGQAVQATIDQLEQK